MTDRPPKTRGDREHTDRDRRRPTARKRPPLHRRATSKAKTPKAAKSRRGRATPGGKPISQIELLMRLRVVEEALIAGRFGFEVCEALADAGYSVPERTARDYVRRVRERWEHDAAEERPMLREAMRRRLTRQAVAMLSKLDVNKARWSDWVRIMELLARVEGNLAPVQEEIKPLESRFEGWTIEELERFIESDCEEVPERFAARGTLLR
jgi:hypothetical protein